MRLPAAAEALDRREHTDFLYIDRSLGIFEGAVFSFCFLREKKLFAINRGITLTEY